MMRIDNIEFYIYEDNLWYIGSDGSSQIFCEDSPMVSSIIDKIQRFYPDAYKALCDEYKKSSQNVPYYQYLIVRRFCKCNFGTLDSSKKDIDDGSFCFEKVACPLRGECRYEGVICCPKFSTEISPAENRVMELLYRGHGVDDISERLYLSPVTVRNHYKSAYKKIGVHSQAEFIRYAQKTKMYGD